MSDEAPVPLERATVAIVGLGLMGSSLGLALAGRCARRVGTDVDPQAAVAARAVGAVDDVGDPADAVRDADLVVLCTPAGEVAATCAALAALMRRDAILTDVASTKATICAEFDELVVPTVGGHPMCGREQSGPAAAEADLYHGATWVLCPTAGTIEPARRLVTELVDAVGASVVELDRDEHDRRVARVSHLPYLAAQALATVADDASLELAATGFASATRMARGDLRMWLDVLRTNSGEARSALAAMRAELESLEQLVDDPAALELRLRAGRSRLARLPRA